MAMRNHDVHSAQAENIVAMVDEPSSTVSCHPDHFSLWYWFEKRSVKIWLKQYAVKDSVAQNSHWITFSSFCSLMKTCLLKNSENDRLHTSDKLEERCQSKTITYMLHKWVVGESLMGSACQSWTREAQYSSMPQLQSMQSVTVMYFCSLPYVRSGKFIFQQDSTPTYRAH